MLLEIKGKPIIQHVWENVSRSKELDNFFVATDDERISDKCRSFGANCVLTPPELPSGTDRIAYALDLFDKEYDIVVNVQGDEPLLSTKTIDELISKFKNSNADVGTLISKIDNEFELFDPSVVKVVLGNNNRALYFSRETIPSIRDIDKSQWLKLHPYWKHIGIYVYTYQALNRFASLEISNLERIEKLEQLRLLEDGAEFYCVRTNDKLIGIDTAEDLEIVRRILE